MSDLSEIKGRAPETFAFDTPIGYSRVEMRYYFMNFVTGLPNNPRGFDAMWVIIDTLTKLAHFIPINIIFPLQKLIEIYIMVIMKLHGVPSSVVSHRDPQFASRFWEILQEALGTKLRLSSAYHPHTSGQTERTIQSLEVLLRACVLEPGGTWDSHLPLIKSLIITQLSF